MIQNYRGETSLKNVNKPFFSTCSTTTRFANRVSYLPLIDFLPSTYSFLNLMFLLFCVQCFVFTFKDVDAIAGSCIYVKSRVMMLYKLFLFNFIFYVKVSSHFYIVFEKPISVLQKDLN